MEGKGVRAVIMCVLILALVVAQIEAKSCCRNTASRNCYNVCRLGGESQVLCARLCDCIHITGTTCPSTHPRSNMLENYVNAIEEVTTDVEASNLSVQCQTPEAKACYSICRLTPKGCAERCGCDYSPRGF